MKVQELILSSQTRLIEQEWPAGRPNIPDQKMAAKRRVERENPKTAAKVILEKPRTTLKKGTPLYHGTDREVEFEHQEELWWPGGFVSPDFDTAKSYAYSRRSGEYGEPRVVEYRLNKTVELVVLDGGIIDELMALSGNDGHVDGFVQFFCNFTQLDIYGWIEPGHEIMFCDTEPLVYQMTHSLEAPEEGVIESSGMKIQELRAYAEHITREDLQQLEAMLDQLYSRVGIDVELNRTHFLQRVNDPRNEQPITINELSKLFRGAFQKYNRKLAQMGPDVEAVLSDIQTKVNVPFALEWDRGAEELDLIAKSALRKKNFYTRDRMLRV